MKRIVTLLFTLALLSTMTMPPLRALADVGPNLITNPTVSTASSGNPTNWTPGSWGTNTTTFSYLANSGHGDTTSLSVAMSTRTSGDAKWIPDAVVVTAGQSYTYSDWYVSNVATELDAQYTNASGTVSYGYLGSVPASTTWKQTIATFVIPANITKVSVMHILYANGSLQTDDFSLTTTVVAPPPTPPADGNLVSNPSFATANGALPDNWNTNTWGTNNAQFIYNTTSGHTDATSATVSVSSYSSGDAKWYANPVTVTAGQNYVYSDWYKSAVTTHVVAAYTNSAGSTSYAGLPDAGTSTAWTRYAAALAIPSGVVKVTVFHLVSAVGSLTIDDVSIVPATAPPAPSSFVPNDSLELASPVNSNLPDSWTSASWGNNTHTFAYMNEGHTGNRSVKTTVSNYVDGDAKWYFNPITTLEKGKQYRWTTWYKTNTTARAVVMFNRADGSEEFFGMPNPFPPTNSATTWSKYSETFLVPQDAVSTTVFLFISRNGWVQVDDQSITSYQPIGWNRPLVSLTFDDGYEENVTNALPVLNQYGFKSTQCFETADLKADPTAGKANVMAFFNTGHEICSHTVTHPFLTTLTTAKVDQELSNSKTYLQNMIGTSVPNFASPYGDYNESVNNEIKKYYSSHRTVDEGFNSKDNFDVYRLRVQNMTPNTTLAEYQSWLNQAKADRTWLILVYHRITDNAPEAFDTRIDPFKQQMAALQASGITVLTMQQAITEVKAQ